MRIETISIKTITIVIFLMIGSISIVLSIFAGDYFKKSALNSQTHSLSRVIEVASQEMLKELRKHTFDLGMKLGHNNEVIQAIHAVKQSPADRNNLVALLDDPFINGFVGFSNINLEKVRLYGLDLNLIAQSSKGIKDLEIGLTSPLLKVLAKRQGIERLKAIDTLWNSSKGPLHSTLVPVGGLRLTAYLEIIVDPAFNISEIGKITRTPINVYTVSGEPVTINNIKPDHDQYLPIPFTLTTSDNMPAFKIISYENVSRLYQEMNHTQIITISGFLSLSIITLVFSLWLFSRFLFVPVRRMIKDMEKITHGRLDLTINNKGLREFYILADAFNSMANQIKTRNSNLERLLDIDDNAILYFGNDNEAIYFNYAATDIFDYKNDEISDLDLGDLFDEDIKKLIDASKTENSSEKKVHTQLTCKKKDGDTLKYNAVISCTDNNNGYAIVLNNRNENSHIIKSENISSYTEQNEQRMIAIEESLKNLLEITTTNPELLSALVLPEHLQEENLSTINDKQRLREQAITVMQSALACWEHDLGKSKLDLAEQSSIWPVYIDKSTPTTRTLDKYLHIDSCPKNPRYQRVIDTAEFVLRNIKQANSSYRKKLEQELETFRLLKATA